MHIGELYCFFLNPWLGLAWLGLGILFLFLFLFFFGLDKSHERRPGLEFGENRGLWRELTSDTPFQRRLLA